MMSRFLFKSKRILVTFSTAGACVYGLINPAVAFSAVPEQQKTKLQVTFACL